MKLSDKKAEQFTKVFMHNLTPEEFIKSLSITQSEMNKVMLTSLDLETGLLKSTLQNKPYTSTYKDYLTNKKMKVTFPPCQWTKGTNLSKNEIREILIDKIHGFKPYKDSLLAAKDTNNKVPMPDDVYDNTISSIWIFYVVSKCQLSKAEQFNIKLIYKVLTLGSKLSKTL